MTSYFINSDDFGASEETNIAIQKSIELGVVHSVSVMTTTPYFSDAVKYLQRHPEVNIGLHVNFIDQGKIIPVHTLVWFLLTKRVTIREVEAQLLDQFKTLKKTGLKVNHLDSHEHIHLYPPLYVLFHRFAKTHHISRVRSSRFSRAQLLLMMRIKPTLKQLIIWVGYGLNALFLPKKYTTHEHVIFDLNWHNCFKTRFFKKLFTHIPPQTEIICHLSSTITTDPLSSERVACFKYITKPETILFLKEQYEK